MEPAGRQRNDEGRGERSTSGQPLPTSVFDLYPPDERAHFGVFGRHSPAERPLIGKGVSMVSSLTKNANGRKAKAAVMRYG